MKVYTYEPFDLNSNQYAGYVIDQNNHTTCTVKVTLLEQAFLGLNDGKAVDASTTDGQALFKGTKKSKWGKSKLELVDCQSGEVFTIFRKAAQKGFSKYNVTSTLGEYSIVKHKSDWTRFKFNKKEVARWITEPKKLITEIEIEEDCPIQESAFFACLCEIIRSLNSVKSKVSQ
nr:hypothetical protein [Lysinibacillus timonensis]